MTAEPAPTPDAARRRAGSVESFVVTVEGIMLLGAAVLVRLSWKRLRATQVSPADAPIVVD